MTKCRKGKGTAFSFSKFPLDLRNLLRDAARMLPLKFQINHRILISCIDDSRASRNFRFLLGGKLQIALSAFLHRARCSYILDT
jgi:hypothetical protein